MWPCQSSLKLGKIWEVAVQPPEKPTDSCIDTTSKCIDTTSSSVQDLLDGKGGRFNVSYTLGNFPLNGTDSSIIESFKNLPFPGSIYDSTGKPIVWNKELEIVTGYSHEEVLSYWKEHGEVMTLLYKGENLKKVQEYLSNVDTTGGYENVAFTMNRKDGTEVTLLWTTIPYGKGGTLRKASVLTDKIKIEEALAKTQSEVDEWKRRIELLEEQNRILEEDNRREKEEKLTDPLTGLLNRRGLLEFIERYIGELFSIVMLDLDFFKMANTIGGHPFGDIILKMFAFFLKKSVRDSDLSIRYGGDEFVAFMDNCNSTNAGRKIDNFRELFSNVVFVKMNNGDILYFYSGNNENHRKIFNDFCTLNSITPIYELPEGFTRGLIVPGNEPTAIHKEGTNEVIGQAFYFSASCGIFTGRDKNEIFHKGIGYLDLADGLTYYVKETPGFIREISIGLDSGELSYVRLGDGGINLIRNSDKRLVLNISSGGILTPSDVKNGVAYYYKERGDIGFKIIKGSRVFTFTQLGLEIFDMIRKENEGNEKYEILRHLLDI